MQTLCELIHNAKNKNSNNMLEIIDMFKPIIKKYAYKLNYEDAENDLILELIQLIYNMPLLNTDGQSIAYISHSVHNFYIKHLRKLISMREHETSYNSELDFIMKDTKHIANDSYIDLYQAINTLSPSQKKVIISKFIFSKSDKEIMDDMKISRQMVYKNKSNALNILKKYLSE